MGGYEPNGLTALVLQRFTVSLTERGLAASTVGGILSVVGSSLKKAVALGLVAAEHTDEVVRPKTRQKKVEAFSLPEQRRIERYICARDDGKLFGVLFCLYTGLRIGELLALEWTDLDLERGVLTVSKTCADSWVNGRYVKITQTPKTETSMRTIPAVEKARHTASRLPHASAHLCDARARKRHGHKNALGDNGAQKPEHYSRALCAFAVRA